jgi:hypothetical protein
MAKCDLCGESCKAYQMQQLRSEYAVDGVNDICSDCASWASKIKSDMIDEIAPRMRAAISDRRYMQKEVWWRRFKLPVSR